MESSLASGSWSLAQVSSSFAHAQAAARYRYVHSSASRRVSMNTIGIVGQRIWSSASPSATTAPDTCSSENTRL
jgi:hypothetical protein